MVARDERFLNFRNYVHAPLERLFETWCNRRSYLPLKYLLSAWAIFPFTTEDWYILGCALIRVRDRAKIGLEAQELASVNSVIGVIDEVLGDGWSSRCEPVIQETSKPQKYDIGRLKEKFLVQEIRKAVDGFLNAWCDRRCASALRYILGVWPIFSPDGNKWADLLASMKHIRSLRDELPESELYEIDSLIIRLEKELNI